MMYNPVGTSRGYGENASSQEPHSGENASSQEPQS